MNKNFGRICCAFVICALLPSHANAVESLFNWTGFYIGVEGGGGGATTKQTNLNTGGTRGDFQQSGGLAGGTVGYNWQQGNFVVGLEGDYAWAHIFGRETNCGLLSNETCPTELRAFGTARGRAGLLLSNSSMIYATGGLAFADIKAYKVATALTGGEAWRTNWTLGGGFETMFAPHWSLKFEYLYTSFGERAATYTIVASGNRVAADERDLHIIRSGVNFRF